MGFGVPHSSLAGFAFNLLIWTVWTSFCIGAERDAPFLEGLCGGMGLNSGGVWCLWLHKLHGLFFFDVKLLAAGPQQRGLSTFHRSALRDEEELDLLLTPLWAGEQKSSLILFWRCDRNTNTCGRSGAEGEVSGNRRNWRVSLAVLWMGAKWGHFFPYSSERWWEKEENELRSVKIARWDDLLCVMERLSSLWGDINSIFSAWPPLLRFLSLFSLSFGFTSSTPFLPPTSLSNIFRRAPILYPLSSWHFTCVALIVQQLRSMRFPQEQKCCTSAASEQHQSSFAVTPSDTCRTDDRLLHLLIPSSKTVEMT